MTRVPSEDTRYDAVVVGCGLMGSALARTLARRGHAVAAWNRTPEKAEALAGEGVAVAGDLAAAVRSSRLVLACIADYDATRAALEQVPTWRDVTLVNVGSGTPDEVDAMEKWATDRGAAYLDGAILCYPQHIGTPEGLVLISGPAVAWADHEPVLAGLGHAIHVSPRTRGASILDVTFAGGFYIASLAAYVEAVSYALSQGMAAVELTDVTQAVLDLMRSTTEDIASSVETGRHSTDQATVSVFAAGARLCRDGMQHAGHPARMLEAAADQLTSTEAAGLGHLGFSALTTI